MCDVEAWEGTRFPGFRRMASEKLSSTWKSADVDFTCELRLMYQYRGL